MILFGVWAWALTHGHPWVAWLLTLRYVVLELIPDPPRNSSENQAG